MTLPLCIPLIIRDVDIQEIYLYIGRIISCFFFKVSDNEPTSLLAVLQIFFIFSDNLKSYNEMILFILIDAIVSNTEKSILIYYITNVVTPTHTYLDGSIEFYIKKPRI